jgi:hypothetical protein
MQGFTDSLAKSCVSPKTKSQTHGTATSLGGPRAAVCFSAPTPICLVYTDPDGKEDEHVIITNNEPKNTVQKKDFEYIYLSPIGPEQNGVKEVWTEVLLDNSNGSKISLSAGLVSLAGETNTPVFVGGNFDLADASMDIGFTNDGVDLAMGVSAISLSANIGGKIETVNREIKGSIGASIGYQAGFQFSIGKNGLVLDVDFIFGGRIEAKWGKKKQ